jgi:2-polyprenyl-3-methyl-5-hydroxy-6-metoxy-1,4-benzoquinol methylase
MTTHKEKSELRFEFGKNWKNFLESLDENRMKEAENSLRNMLDISTLKGKTFLDIVSGSGLFSLAAKRLGAKVHSFDYDTNSVGCTKYLKEKFEPNAKDWAVEQGSILDKKYLKTLPKADVVYSWGVLHHTGSMYQAFENVSELVKPKGYLFISIYNNQGGASRRWTWIKKKYNASGLIVRSLLELYTLFRQWTITFIRDFLNSGNPFKSWVAYKQNRGMSAYHDLIDWVGGYPFEVAKPEEVFAFFKNKGFKLVHLKTCAGGVGCNEFVFQRES